MKINLKDEGLNFEELRKTRLQTTMSGIVRALKIIGEETRPGAILVASHNVGLAAAIGALVSETDSTPATGVIGFAERMPQEILDLKSEGLFFLDLERDCRAFKKPLHRSLGYDLEALSAEEIL